MASPDSKARCNGYKFGSPNPFGHQSFGFITCSAGVVAAENVTDWVAPAVSVIGADRNAMAPSVPLMTPDRVRSLTFLTDVSIVTSALSVRGSGSDVVT